MWPTESIPGTPEPTNTPATLQVAVLGPIATTVAGRDIDPGTHQARAVLAYLVLNAGRAIALAELRRALTPDRSRSTDRGIRAAIGHLAAILPAGAVTTGEFARCSLAPGALDAERFVALIDSAARSLIADDRPGADADARAALALWRSDPYPELADCLDALPERQRLSAARLRATELRYELLSPAEVDFAVVAELKDLATAHPSRRALRLQLARALHLRGRQVESLAMLRDTITTLGDSPATRRMTTLIAHRDPAAAHTSTIEWDEWGEAAVP